MSTLFLRPETATKCRGGFWSILLLLVVLTPIFFSPSAHAGGTKSATAVAGGPSAKRLLIVGSTTLAPLVEKISQQFMRQHPGVEIVVETGGSGRAVKDAAAGKADIGMVSRPLEGDEKALFMVPVARDGVTLIVHKNNPIRSLSKDQARDIYTGRATNWKMVGGANQPIEVHGRVKGQGAAEVLNHYLSLRTEDLKLAREVLRNEDVVSAVVANTQAVGVFSVCLTEDAVAHGFPVKAIALDGVTPIANSIRNGSWPMSRPLALVTRSVPSGLAQEFIQFALSATVRPLILEEGFIPY